MSRPLRIEFNYALYHVTSRGDRREDIFENDEDRKSFLDILASVVERYNWIVHSYCLMDNHYHLMIETPDANLSIGMRYLNGVYTQKYNKTHKIVGHLFQGRFKSILVQKDAYLLELSRYIVLNPVRAKMVTLPEQWEWSSYRATAGMEEPPKFLTNNWLLSQFGDELNEAQESYKQFVLKGIRQKTSPFKDLKNQIVLGKKTFIKKITSYMNQTKTMNEIPKVERFASRPGLDEIFDDTENMDKVQRNKKIFDAYMKYGYAMKEISQKLNIHYSTVSKIIKNIEQKMEKSI